MYFGSSITMDKYLIKQKKKKPFTNKSEPNNVLLIDFFPPMTNSLKLFNLKWT